MEPILETTLKTIPEAALKSSLEATVTGALIFPCACVKSSVTKPVIQFPLFLISQYVISLINFLKTFCGLCIPFIAVRMVFFCQLSECFFDCLRIRMFVNAQNLIVVSFHSPHFPSDLGST